MSEPFVAFILIVLGGALTLAVNGLFVIGLRRTVRESNDHTSNTLGSLIHIVGRYREVAEGALAALTRRCEVGDSDAEKLEQTNADMARALQNFTEVFNAHLTRTDARAELVSGLQEEVRYLRRVAFADNEYIKAVQDPTAQGAVAAQVRRETEPPPVAGRPPMRTFRHRMEESDFPPTRARARGINLDDPVGARAEATAADAIAQAEEAANPWGAKPGMPPAVVRPQNMGGDVVNLDGELAGELPKARE